MRAHSDFHAAQPEQEPMAFVHPVPDHCDRIVWRNSYYHLPTPPLRKPWVSLTDEQRNEIARQADENDWHDYDIIDAVEAKLRELNEAPQRKLTDEEFLELLLRKGSAEVVGYCTFVGGSMQMQGRVGLLRSAKLIKEFIEDIYGIKEKL